MIQVGVNGYGTIGKRVADAVAAQPDMQLTGVAKTRPNYEAETAVREAPVRHTVLRPGALTGGPRTDDVTVAEPGARLWGLVSRADVARLMVAAPTTPDAADRTFEVVATPSLHDRAVDVEWRLPGGEP